jgi:hypothetical protein
VCLLVEILKYYSTAVFIDKDAEDQLKAHDNSIQMLFGSGAVAAHETYGCTENQ